MFIKTINDKTYLYEYQYDSRREKVYPKVKGHFLFHNGKFCFQFAGTSFQMSGSKKYESTLKEIDTSTKTWIALNKDRKAKRKNIGATVWWPFIMEALSMEIMSLIVE